MAMYYTADCGSLAEALATITGLDPPFDLRAVHTQADVDEQTMLALCDWCSSNARPAWATGESIYDAAWLMVERAIENDNI